MAPKKRRRLAFALALVVAGAGGAALVLGALKDNVLYFYSPSDIAAKHVSEGVAFRIGGLVAPGSVVKSGEDQLEFSITDGSKQVRVSYEGQTPDLFREGQGVVALGALGPGRVFDASEVLAKHDERYMPPEVVDALKRSGRWKEGEGSQ